MVSIWPCALSPWLPRTPTKTILCRFYVNTLTKKSQWDKPTAPATPASDAPDGPPPGYTPGSSAPATAGQDIKAQSTGASTNPFDGNSKAKQEDEDARLARQLQEEEDNRAGNRGGPSPNPGAYGSQQPPYGQPQYGAPPQPQYGQGAAASYLNSGPPPGGASPYGQPGYGEPGYGGQPGYGAPSPQPGYGSPYGQQGYPPPQQQQTKGGFLGKLLGGKNKPHGGGGGLPFGGGHGGASGYGGYGGHGGGYGGYGGGYGGHGGGYGSGKKPGMGMGAAAGGLALGAGAGLIGGALVADAINDHDQEIYQEGYRKLAALDSM
jgi:hypothetical protein